MCDAPIGTTRWSPAKIEIVSKKLMYSGGRRGNVTSVFSCYLSCVLPNGSSNWNLSSQSESVRICRWHISIFNPGVRCYPDLDIPIHFSLIASLSLSLSLSLYVSLSLSLCMSLWLPRTYSSHVFPFLSSCGRLVNPAWKFKKKDNVPNQWSLTASN